MTRIMVAIALFGVLLAVLLNGGIYAGVSAGGTSDRVEMYRINRFTGSMVVCQGFACIAVEFRARP